MEKITFQELKDRRLKWETAIIVYTKDSFNKPYSLQERSYRLSDNTMWGLDDTKIGRCIVGDSLDGTDSGVRLDAYDWEIDYCYIETFVKQ